MSRFTYKILFDTSSPDDVVKMGAIEKSAALSFVKTFPFKRELAKRERDPSLVAPTIIFHDSMTRRYLAVRSEAPGRYAVWQPDAEARADGVQSMLKVLACVTLFFDGKARELNHYIRNLAAE